MIGQTIGSYNILRQIGEGAMGRVYLAEHRHLKRKAALKLLTRELVDRPDLLERFFLEARATSAIAHPGIVQIFDCEVDATGQPYIVMEYLEGDTLAALLTRLGPLGAAVVARLTQAMAEALDAAHAKGIVHRDLKPENMFVRSETHDAIKLVDFGIAKLAGDLQANQVHKTRSGTLMGTPLYMSPEQCRDSGKLDYRTDLYSLGCVMFEMLTGRPPFTGEGVGDLMVAHLTQQPQDARALNPSVPPALAKLAAQLLEKDPASRPANMREVAQRCLAFLGGMTTLPEAAPPAAALAATQTKPPRPADVRVTGTTFEHSASEVLPAADDWPNPGHRRAWLMVVAILVIGGSATAGLVATRTSPPATPSSAAATVAAPAAPAAPEPPAKAPAVAAELPPPRPTAPATAPARDGRGKKASEGPRKPASAPRNLASAASVVEPARGARPSEGLAAPAFASAPSPAATPTPTPTPAAVPPDQTEPTLPGAWEGAWEDPANRQRGRLSLHIAVSGNVSGWMYNQAAKQSYRMVGSTTVAGQLTLTCKCPPGQGFAANGTIRLKGGSELAGNVALSTGTSVFGHSQFVLRRTQAR